MDAGQLNPKLAASKNRHGGVRLTAAIRSLVKSLILRIMSSRMAQEAETLFRGQNECMDRRSADLAKSSAVGPLRIHY